MGRKKRFGCLRVTALVLVLGLVGGGVWFYFYTAGYYRAEEGAFVQAEGITLVETNAYLALEPQEKSDAVGYIFYPGGLVAEDAYLPYLQQVAEGGYLCAVVRVPFHLAVFKPNAANAVRSAYPEIETWVIGGHSLGGVMAASYANKNEPAVEGLVLLAAYPNTDLTGSRLFVTTITATADGVLNAEKWQEAKRNLPSDTAYVSIAGGNHGGFGRYGHQKGDGAATISRQQQQDETAAATLELLHLLAS